MARESKYRFVKEYAKYALDKVKTDSYSNEEAKEKAVARINKAISSFERGYILPQDCVKEITNTLLD